MKKFMQLLAQVKEEYNTSVNAYGKARLNVYNSISSNK